MKNQIDSGVVVSYTNGTGNDIAAGALVIMGKMAGVAVNDIANGATGAVSVKGKYQLTKKTATDVNKMAVKASYSTKVNDFNVGAGVEFAVTDIADLSNTYEVTVDGSASYAMGGVTMLLMLTTKSRIRL